MSPFTGIPATGNGCGVDHRNNHIPTAGPTTTPGHPRCQPHLKTDDKTGDTTRNRRIDYEINALQPIRNEKVAGSIPVGSTIQTSLEEMGFYTENSHLLRV